MRDAAGGPRGVVRLLIKWKYPFKATHEEREQGMRQEEAESGEKRTGEKKREEKPIAKPRLKVSDLLNQD